MSDALTERANALVFTVRGLSALEMHAPKPLGWFLQELQAGRCGCAVATWLLWAGSLSREPDLTVETVEAEIDAALKNGPPLVSTRPAILTALARAFSGPEGNAQPEAAADPSPTSGS